MKKQINLNTYANSYRNLHSYAHTKRDSKNNTVSPPNSATAAVASLYENEIYYSIRIP